MNQAASSDREIEIYRLLGELKAMMEGVSADVAEIKQHVSNLYDQIAELKTRLAVLEALQGDERHDDGRGGVGGEDGIVNKLLKLAALLATIVAAQVGSDQLLDMVTR